MKLLLTSLLCCILTSAFAQSDIEQDLRERWQPDHFTAIALQRIVTYRDTAQRKTHTIYYPPDSIRWAVDFFGGSNPHVRLGDASYKGFKIDPGWNDTICGIGWIEPGPAITLTHYRRHRPYYILWVEDSTECYRYTLEAKKE